MVERCEAPVEEGSRVRELGDKGRRSAAEGGPAAAAWRTAYLVPCIGLPATRWGRARGEGGRAGGAAHEGW